MVTGLTLVVWTVYGQILHANAKRQRTPRIFIKQGWGDQMDSVCLLSNMSKESIYVRAVFLNLQTRHGRFRAAIEDERSNPEQQAADERDAPSSQGPLAAGTQMNLGTFRHLIAEAALNTGMTDVRDTPIDALNLRGFDVTAAVSFGPSERIIGARRAFAVGGEHHDRIAPTSTETALIKGRRGGRRIHGYLRAFTEAVR